MVRNGNNFLQICKQLGALTSQDWTPGDLLDFLVTVANNSAKSLWKLSKLYSQLKLKSGSKVTNYIVTYCERKDNSFQKIVCDSDLM
jgi:hypothetical protein